MDDVPTNEVPTQEVLTDDQLLDELEMEKPWVEEEWTEGCAGSSSNGRRYGPEWLYIIPSNMVKYRALQTRSCGSAKRERHQ